MHRAANALQALIWMKISGAAQEFQAFTFPSHPCGLPLSFQCCKNLLSEFALNMTPVKCNF